jgi:hypothetical protein
MLTGCLQLSVPLLTANAKKSKSAPANARLKLGYLDCDRDEMVCTAWATGVPVIYHLLVPASTSPVQTMPLHIVPLNISTTTVSDITSIPSTHFGGQSRYTSVNEYAGAFHPFDGILVKTGLLMPIGYFMWALGSTPGWVMMLGISFVSRQIMSKRMQGNPSLRAQEQALAAARQAEANKGTSTGARPQGQQGGKKRR